MGRIMAIDYGRRRCGVAVTDPLRIAANGLPTVAAPALINFIADYCSREQVDFVVVGEPKTLKGEKSDSARYIEPFLGRLRHAMPDLKVVRFDERFTTTIAHREMIAAGVPKMKRRVQELADETAAVLILSEFLESRLYQENYKLK